MFERLFKRKPAAKNKERGAHAEAVVDRGTGVGAPVGRGAGVDASAGRGAGVGAPVGRGFMVFENTSEVILAEKVLKKAGWPIRVMGPPPEIQTGCDLVIEFPLIEELDLLRELGRARVPPLKVVPVTAPLLAPVDLFHTTDFGDYLMVRAANMKITIRKQDTVIVNISGGGCPDVPYLAQEMVGRTLREAPRARDLGYTLCGYALELAHAELLRTC